MSEVSALMEFPTEDELLVAEILLDLPRMIEDSKPQPRSLWVRKKRRSCLDNPPPREDSSAATAAAAADSPVSPLSYNPSESDDRKKSRRGESPKRSSEKTPKQEYVDMVKELIQSREVLRGELEKVTKYHDKLRAYNSLLKEAKQEVLNSRPKREEEETGLEMALGSMNLGMKSTQQQHVDQPQPSVSGRTAEDEGPIEAQFTNGPGPDRPDNLGGPIEIPDLNLSPDEKMAFELGSEPSRPLDGCVDDDKRARYAEARRRKGLVIVKSTRSACGIRLHDKSS